MKDKIKSRKLWVWLTSTAFMIAGLYRREQTFTWEQYFLINMAYIGVQGFLDGKFQTITKALKKESKDG